MPTPEPNSIGVTLGLLGDQWNLLLVQQALLGRTRFSEFLEVLPISNAVLTARLRALTSAESPCRRRPHASTSDEAPTASPARMNLAPALGRVKACVMPRAAASTRSESPSNRTETRWTGVEPGTEPQGKTETVTAMAQPSASVMADTISRA